MISDRDPRFTSHFGKALSEKLGIERNLSTAFHPQTDGLSERKNQWIEQYLRLVTSNNPKGWTHWLALATMVHNNRINTTTRLSPNQILFGYNPTLNSDKVLQTHNSLVESRVQVMTKNRADAIRALNKVANQKGPPPAQFHLREQVWLDASHLKLPHQKAKLTPKRLGPFKIIQEISPVAYRLELPPNWRIHDVFHASLLTPYHETAAHGPNFTRPPPDLIDGEEEYEVERIVAHRQFGRSKRLQYLIKWKGYPESDNTWEPADQVHAPELIKHYHSAATHQSSAVHHQSATRKIHQSAPSQSHIKTLRTLPQLSIECPTIFPAFLSNAFRKTSLSKISLPSNAPNTTSTPPNLAPTASSASATSSGLTTYQYITGIVNCPTAPFITVTSPCRISLAMSPQNPSTPLAMGDPLPPLSLIRLLKSSPRCSQAPSSHVPEYLDSLLPLPMLQYPQDPLPPKTTSSPSDRCLPDQSAPPRKRTTKRSWMTVKRRSNSSRPVSSDTLTPSPSRLLDMSKTAISQRLLSLSEGGSPTRPSGSRSSTTVEWRGIPLKTALTTSRTCVRSMHPPSIQLTLRSRYLIGSTKPFKGPPPLTLPSSTPAKPPTTGGSKPTSCGSEPSTSASWPIRPSSTIHMVSSKVPSSPETNVGAGWSAHDLPNGFRIWRENHSACPPATEPAGDGRRDEGIASKRGCDVIDLTNEDSSSDE